MDTSSTKANGPTWYADGLRFECQRCGRCCSGPPGVVEFTKAEGLSMAKQLQLSWQDFFAQYARLEQDQYFLNELPEDAQHGIDCVMLERDEITGLASCRVHTARPSQCRTWPFWKLTLRSPRAWRHAGIRCPGIDKGPSFSLDEINSTLDESPC